MSIMDKASKHFQEQIENKKLGSYYVKEWDETIYFKPVLTWKEQSQILDLSTNGKTSEALITTLIIRACDKTGTPLFTKADKLLLENDVDPNVLVNIVAAMNAESVSDVGVVKKK